MCRVHGYTGALRSIQSENGERGGTLRLELKRPSAHGPIVSSTTTFFGGILCRVEKVGEGSAAEEGG